MDLAERADGEFDQRVALKLIKRGIDTDEVVRRFQRERQILADLDVRKMRVMSAPKNLHALAGFDLEVVEFVDTD